MNRILLIGLFSMAFCSACQSDESGDENTASAQFSPVTEFDSTVQSPSDVRTASIYTSIDGGLSWSAAAVGLPEGTQVNFVDTLSDRLIIGTEHRGVWYCAKDAMTWRQFDGGFGSSKTSAMHSTGGRLLVCFYKMGLYATDDLGMLWQNLNEGLPDKKILDIQKVNGALVIATDSGLYRRRDKETTWQQVFAGEQCVSLDRSGKKCIAGSTAGILLSSDEGVSWDWIQRGSAVHQTAIIDNTVFAMYISADLFVSSDWGKQWTLANYAPQRGSYVYDVVKGGGALWLSNNYGLHRSVDSGANWDLRHPRDSVFYFDLLNIEGVLYGGTKTGFQRFQRSP